MTIIPDYFSLQDYTYGPRVDIIKFWQLIFSAIVDQAQLDFLSSSDGYVSGLGRVLRLEVQPSASVFPHLQVSHTLWALQQIAEQEWRRRVYSGIRASINVRDSRGRDVEVGTIEMRAPQASISGNGELNEKVNQVLESQTLDFSPDDYKPISLPLPPTLARKVRDIDGVRFRFVQNGIKITIEHLFVTMIRIFATIAVHPALDAVPSDLYFHDPETDVSVVLRQRVGHEGSISWLDFLAAMDACVAQGLERRRFKDAVAGLEKDGVDLADVYIIKGPLAGGSRILR